MQSASRRRLICTVVFKTVAYSNCCWIGLAVTQTRKRSSRCSRFMSLWSSSLLYSSLSFSLIHHVMSSHRFLATGRKPEPLACCRSEGRLGSILLADAKWTAPLGHTMHNTGGPLGVEGDMVGSCLCAHADILPQNLTHRHSQRCTSAAVVWFIANEYLPAGLAVSETAVAHRGNIGVEPLVAESCTSISNTSCCQSEGFTLHARLDMHQCAVRGYMYT